MRRVVEHVQQAKVARCFYAFRPKVSGKPNLFLLAFQETLDLKNDLVELQELDNRVWTIAKENGLEDIVMIVDEIRTAVEYRGTHPLALKLEVRAVAAALHVVGDLQRPPFMEWRDGIDLMDWLGAFFRFQNDIRRFGQSILDAGTQYSLVSRDSRLLLFRMVSKTISNVSRSFLISLSCLQIVEGIGTTLGTPDIMHGHQHHGIGTTLGTPDIIMLNVKRCSKTEAKCRCGKTSEMRWQTTGLGLPTGAHLLLLLRLPRSKIDNDDK
ncbi:hypothetical protein Tco_0211190 [Tanacetum coccineum]